MRSRVVFLWVALLFLCGTAIVLYAQSRGGGSQPRQDRVDLQTQTWVGKRLERTEDGPNGQKIYHYTYRVEARPSAKNLPRYIVDNRYGVSYKKEGFKSGDSVTLLSTNEESETDSPIWVYNVTYVGSGSRSLVFSTSGSVLAPVFAAANSETEDDECEGCGCDLSEGCGCSPDDENENDEENENKYVSHCCHACHVCNHCGGDNEFCNKLCDGGCGCSCHCVCKVPKVPKACAGNECPYPCCANTQKPCTCECHCNCKSEKCPPGAVACDCPLCTEPPVAPNVACTCDCHVCTGNLKCPGENCPGNKECLGNAKCSCGEGCLGKIPTCLCSCHGKCVEGKCGKNCKNIPGNNCPCECHCTCDP